MPTIEGIVNQALDLVGYKRHIGNIWEGTKAARVALDLWGQSRDAALYARDWPFATREVALSAVVGQSPIVPWQYEYQYPSDCIKIRYLQPSAGSRSNDPKPIAFMLWNDQRFSPAVQAILSDQATPILIYTGRIIDPATWTADYTEMLIEILAEAFKIPLGIVEPPKEVKNGSNR